MVLGLPNWSQITYITYIIWVGYFKHECVCLMSSVLQAGANTPFKVKYRKKSTARTKIKISMASN